VLSTSGDLRTWTLKSGSIALGNVALELEGTLEKTHDPKGAEDGTRVIGTWSLPTLSCGDALASMPKGLMPKLDGLAMAGTLEAHGAVSLDTRARDKAVVELAIDQRCRVTKVPAALDTSQFQRPFELRVYDPKGNSHIETFGPGTATWTPFERISPYVVDALLTCEDGAFFSHHGFSGFAIRNALLANLKAGKFLLGASTISMQLAKNVFLDRRKVLSRKLQEAVLTAWLEQSMTKPEILELYLNVVEFGPNLYGIGAAARHYFGRPASDLDPLEALFLVSILPSPVRSHGMWERGAPSEGYLSYLRRLMREEHARGRLDDDEYADAKDEPLAFHRPDDPAPPPRIPGAHVKLSPEGVDDPAFDPAWAPVGN
jgi:membrane peptidoglycan carboxypeptidase